MKNVDLNTEEIVGALLGGALGVVVLMHMRDGDMGRRRGKLVVPGVILGALAGNFLWGMVFGHKTDDEAGLETAQAEEV